MSRRFLDLMRKGLVILAKVVLAGSLVLWALASAFLVLAAGMFSLTDRFNGNHFPALMRLELCLLPLEALIVLVLRGAILKFRG